MHNGRSKKRAAATKTSNASWCELLMKMVERSGNDPLHDDMIVLMMITMMMMNDDE